MVLDPQVIGSRSLFTMNSGLSQLGPKLISASGQDLSNFAIAGAGLNSEGITHARFQPVSLSLER
jgi:hypothetical protein